MLGYEHVVARVNQPWLGVVHGGCGWLCLQAQIQSCRPLSSGPLKAEQALSLAQAA